MAENNVLSTFKPVRFLTDAERAELAWRYDHRYDRPGTDDWSWHDACEGMREESKGREGR